MTAENVNAAAERLWSAAQTGEPCAPVRDLIGEADIEAAYTVQEILTRRRLDGGERIVGRKIGLTSAAVQKQLGVGQPDFGALFDTMDVALGADIAWADASQPKVEAEIAFVLERDLDMERPGAADVLRAIGFAVPALEIVGSRIRDWDIRIADTIADNASSGQFVLGHTPLPLSRIDLRLSGMTLMRNGEPVSHGAGAACMGSPLNAVRWLAGVMARSGNPLRAGEVILSGALGPMVPAAPGDAFEAHIEGLGSVSVGFGEEEEA